MRKAIIKAADNDLLEAITERLLNICKHTIKISPTTYKKLAQYLRHIEVVADKSKHLTQRRRVIYFLLNKIFYWIKLVCYNDNVSFYYSYTKYHFTYKITN